MRRIHVIHWKPAEAEPLLQAVRKAGFSVDYCEEPQGTLVTRAIRENVPAAVVIDLSRLPSHGREMAVWLRSRKGTRHVPIVFVGGEPAKVIKLAETLPDAVFTQLAQLAPVLKKLPPKIESPATPPTIMQRYAGRTAAQKLGIRQGDQVSVTDPPRDYLTVLGEMPADVELVEQQSDESPNAGSAVTVWFLHDPETFLACLSRMPSLAARTKLWLLWRKGSENGITQNFLRETAICAGLVDYKICSVDGHWSGIAFARSRR